MHKHLSQASEFRELVSDQPVQVIAVTAGKGGVGKTNVTVNLGILLAKHKRVLLLDSDLGLANVDVLLGLSASRNISHVLQGECELQDIIIDGPCGLKIIPAASGQENMLHLNTSVHHGLISAFGKLTDNVDILLIDTAAGIAENVSTYLQAAQEIIVIVADEPASLTDAFSLIKRMNHEYGCYRFRVIANMVDDVKDGRDLYVKLTEVTDQYLDVTLDYLGAIPHDDCVRQAIKQQQAVVQAYPTSRATRELKKISEKILDWPVDISKDGESGFFMERLLRFKSQTQYALSMNK